MPCTEYSQAKTVGNRDLDLADRLVRRTVDIIKYFNPLLWWIENPRYGKLRERGILKGVVVLDVDYCQFSDWGYKKPTRIWGSPQLLQLSPKLCGPSCPNKHPETNRHKASLGGSHMELTTWEKGRMPTDLIKYLISAEPSFYPTKGEEDQPPSFGNGVTEDHGGQSSVSDSRKKSGLDLFLDS